MIDVVSQVSAVRRQVGTRTLEAGEARVVSVGQAYEATPEELWGAVTDAERIGRWFQPVTGELRLHGRYQVEGNAGGTVTACDPPKRFAATWEFGEQVSWIEVTLTPEPDGRTRFTLEHLSDADGDEHWQRYGPGAAGIGWDLSLLGLGLHLASGGAPVDREAVEAWMTSDGGRDFVTRSGEAWGAADIAGGEDPAVARERADRTIAFYRG